jgi:hypothetical protein
MSKQISLNMPGSENRAEKIASHLKSFWNPKMINELYVYLKDNKSEFPEEVVDALNQIIK